MTGNRKIIVVFFIILLSAQLKAQLSPDKLKLFFSSSSLSSNGLQYGKQVKEFYNAKGFFISWLTTEGRNNLALLSKYINHSSDVGLRQQDYQPELFKTYNNALFSAINEEDSLLAEIKFTDAAIHFLHDVLMGNQQERFSYDGLNYQPSCYDIPEILNQYLMSGKFSSLLNELESTDAAYLLVKSKIFFFRQIISTDNFKDAVITSPKVNNTNRSLIIRLCQLGFIASDTAMLNEAVLKTTIKEIQTLFGLLSDGVLRSTTLKAFNVPLAARVAELEYTLNTLRWLNCIKQSNHIIVVNIPSATLLLYEHGKIVLESRVIVGKKSTPTPSLCSKITEVILYPYWTVPNKIATQELLPVIKLNYTYLQANNFQVLNKQGKVMNPANIDWHVLSRNNFPYTIRQSTGCDNSLGLIKLNFYNPFSVYLHDTPGKFLFSLNKRYFSHGCMRLQKAMEVAHYILRNNSIAIDTLEEKGCLKNQAPVTVSATETIPVFVLYHTAWIDSAASLSFHEDVYNKFPALHKQLHR